VHTTGDAERAFAFYRDVLGIELAPSPFVPASNARPEGIRPVAQAGSDALVWDLTNTHGSRFRTVFMRASNTPFGLELSEFFDIPRETRAANPWDPGASRLIFAVRDLGSVVTMLAARSVPIVTLGAVPVDTPAGRAILVRDPDGYLIELRQASQQEIASANATGPVIETSIGLTVADVRTASSFYVDLLRFEVRDSRRASDGELRLNGLAGGALSRTSLSIPRIGVIVVLSQFAVPAGVAPAQPFRWKIEDVGAPQFQLEVTGLDALLEQTTAAGYRFLSVGGRPIQRPFGRFVFAIDADGVLVEYVEPAVAR
jgi:catechol 2,3-dioxygenase-like lactoylglutathione lyase family enzyme